MKPKPSPLTAAALLLCTSIVLLSTGQARAEEMDDAPWGLTSSLGVYSDYMFRGKNVYEGTSIQPSVTGYYGFDELGTLSANLWMHVPGETNEPPEKFTELDATFSYDVSIDVINVAGGFILYRFPGEGGRIEDTEEYFASISANVFLNPTVTFYNDISKGKYQYFTASIRESFPVPAVSENLALTPYTSFGFALNADDGPVFYENDGLEHVDMGVYFDIQLGQFFLAPSFNVTLETDDGATNEFWIGIDFGVSI
ncbi:MAG: hypothetical protein KDD44_07740 [Bdellovibrionales bacterium]|nr:hypothetical protein [Bdellovibrionales bacterium]